MSTGQPFVPGPTPVSDDGSVTPVDGADHAGRPEGRQSLSARLGAQVGTHIGRLQAGVLGRQSPVHEARARAALAELRRARPDDVSAHPLSLPLSIGFLDDDLLGHGASATAVERAAHAAVVLYAIHQQSQRAPMHVPGVSLGAAAGRLARQHDPSDLDAGAIRRFTAVIGAGTYEEAVYHVRSFIGLLQSAEPPIGLDYQLLARDLFALQHPAGGDSVRLRWTRDLHRSPRCGEPGDTATGQHSTTSSSDPTPGE